MFSILLLELTIYTLSRTNKFNQSGSVQKRVEKEDVVKDT